VEPLAAGQLLDHYTILENLGQGAISTAYMARDDRDGRVVVLKCPNPVILGDTTALDRFRREMAICRTLHHPNIQTAVDAGEKRSVLYLALEYVDARSLSDILSEQGRFEPQTTRNYALQLLSALEYAHGQRVFHRDLKPSNVLVTTDGQLKIIDFGIAHAAHTRRLTWQWAGSTLGTPHYMSPEQVQGKRGDARSDIYALGAMMYEMLTGRPAFEGDDILEIMHQHLKKTPDPPSSRDRRIPEGMNGIVLKALRKKPEERYQSAAEMSADLRRYEDLTSKDFSFEPETEMDEAHPDRLLVLIGLGVAVLFVLAAGAVVVAAYVASSR
jgi:eukaryotic-like serine/threonine-protein kinase